jgi:hypothetical protein
VVSIASDDRDQDFLDALSTMERKSSRLIGSAHGFSQCSCWLFKAGWPLAPRFGARSLNMQVWPLHSRRSRLRYDGGSRIPRLM